MSKISNWPLQWRAELGTWEGVLLKPPITDYWPTGHTYHLPTDLPIYVKTENQILNMFRIL